MELDSTEKKTLLILGLLAIGGLLLAAWMVGAAILWLFELFTGAPPHPPWIVFVAGLAVLAIAWAFKSGSSS